MLVYLLYCCDSVYMYIFLNCIMCMYSGQEAAYYQINQAIKQSIQHKQSWWSIKTPTRNTNPDVEDND